MSVIHELLSSQVWTFKRDMKQIPMYKSEILFTEQLVKLCLKLNSIEIFTVLRKGMQMGWQEFGQSALFRPSAEFRHLKYT